MNNSKIPTAYPARPVRKIYVLMDEKGRYLVNTDDKVATFADSPIDALRWGMSWLTQEVAVRKLAYARRDARPCPPLTIATAYVAQTRNGWEICTEEDFN